jgi:hypothetical protein
MRDLAPIAAMLVLAATAACNPDLGEPVETVIIQDAGADGDASADGDADAAPVIVTGGPGADCTKNTDCQSNICFIGGKASYCSFVCTPADAMTACATPPFNGVCNMQGFCRRP